MRDMVQNSQTLSLNLSKWNNKYIFCKAFKKFNKFESYISPQKWFVIYLHAPSRMSNVSDTSLSQTQE